MKQFPIPPRPAPSGGEDPTPAYAKGGNVKTCSYAEGGPVLGRERSFMKEPDPYSAGMDPGNSEFIKTKPKPGSPQDYAGGKPKGKDKSLKTVMPRT